MDALVNDILSVLSENELLKRIDDENHQDEIDLDNVNSPAVQRVHDAYNRAETNINPYILPLGISFPMETIPDTLQEIRRQLVVVELYRRRRRDDLPESIEKLEAMQYKKLDKIREKKLSLGLETPKSKASSEVASNKTASDRIFNKELMGKFRL